jgi:hypothetical protein
LPFESRFAVSFGSLSLTEIKEDDKPAHSQRFPYLLKSDNGLQIKINSIDRKSPEYKNVDVDVEVKSG